MSEATTFQLDVNGSRAQVLARADTPLAYVLRNDLGLTGTKLGCGLEQCGACKVLVDGEPAYSCTLTLQEAAGRSVTTVEGLASTSGPSALQQAFIEQRAAQCGYCTAGLLISASALLREQTHPSAAQIRAALEGHLCRCGSHPRVERAVMSVVEASK
jgi:nicotinate dehydrogenase subunit A